MPRNPSIYRLLSLLIQQRQRRLNHPDALIRIDASRKVWPVLLDSADWQQRCGRAEVSLGGGGPFGRAQLTPHAALVMAAAAAAAWHGG
jgi:hypothetical protein